MPAVHEAWLNAPLIPWLWMAWLAYWIISARDVKQSARRESWLSRCAHLAPLVIAAVLVGGGALPVPGYESRFMPRAAWTSPAGTAVTAAGLSFAAWARVHLGRNWSGIVTIKQDHELITSGPYAWVRHPIYTGLVIAFAGSALAQGQWRGLLAVAIVFSSFWFKRKLEERWMRERFGAAYDDYARRVKALIPFVL